MGFIQIINRKKITIISFFLFFYIILNLLDGERGLISYYEKQNINKQLLKEKNFLTKQLNIVEKKNELLTEKIDLDYLEILFREKFMFGKPNEKIYKSN
jgi:cell division protein FtsB|tara:strand:+ start:2565 stop:2861 length:297 start_codon:yes stop_codon:yes gene_type:complete